MGTKMYHGLLGDLAESRVDDFLREAQRDRAARRAQAWQPGLPDGVVVPLADLLIAVGLSLKAGRSAIGR